MNPKQAIEVTNNMKKHILYKKLYNSAGRVDYPIRNITIFGTPFNPEKIKIYVLISLDETKHVIGELKKKSNIVKNSIIL